MTVDVKRVYEEIASDEGKILHVYLCSDCLLYTSDAADDLL